MKNVEHYDKHGYAVFRSFFTGAEISSMEQHVDRIFKKWFDENEDEIFSRKLVNMHSLTSPEYFEGLPEERMRFFEAIASEKLTQTLDSMFGQGVCFHNSQLFFNPTNNTRLPYWHRDMQYSAIDDAIQNEEQHKMLTLHVRIPLVKEKGVEVVAGTHKRWDSELEHNVRLELNGHKNSEPLPDSVLIDLTPGDVLIFNAQMIHRGNYDLNPTRKALDLCAGKYHPLSASFLDDRVLPNDSEIDQIANNRWYKLALQILGKNST